MALKAENMSKCCVRSDGKGEAQLRLPLDKGQTQGEEQGRAAGIAFTPQLSKQGPAAFPVPPLEVTHWDWAQPHLLRSEGTLSSVLPWAAEAKPIAFWL